VAHDEMDVFPVSEREGVHGSRGREGSETGGEPDGGVEKDSEIAGGEITKNIMHDRGHTECALQESV